MKKAGRILAIGDIHGCVDSLKTLLQEINPTTEDTLIFLGDYVDRGAYSKEVIDLLIACDQKFNCRFIKGNHEEAMVASMFYPEDVAHFWLQHGGEETLKSYGVDDVRDLKEAMPEAHFKFLNRLEDAIELDDYIFVHASWDPDKKLAQQDTETLRYKFFEQATVKGKKMVICGHAAQRTGLPAKKGNIQCIDTGMGIGEWGWLTAFDLTHNLYHQVNEDGKKRNLTVDQIIDFKKYSKKDLKKNNIRL